MKAYHLIGIKGAGMSALAQILYDMGYVVQGSDVDTTYFTQYPLEEKGIPILPFREENIQEGFTVIAGNAFGDQHVEVEAARRLGNPFHRYHDFLADFMQGFTSIAVTGSHGKTSTTGLLAHVLQALKPTSLLIGDGTGRGVKESTYFVFEACEYKRHFLAYEPDYAIITNIDYDHPDYFRNIEDVKDAFSSLTKQVRKQIVGCGDDPHVQALSTTVPILTYGFGVENEIQARSLVNEKQGVTFDLYQKGERVEQFTIPMFGRHSVLNSLAVIGICMAEGLPLGLVKKQLATFQGVKRRFAEKQLGRQLLIDDYAHHPTEISATIEAVRAKYPDKTLVTIFQPHTYSRTSAFLDQFARSLSPSDHVFLCDIFGSAREQDGDLTIHDLQQRIPSSKLMNEDSVEQLVKYPDAVLLFMGAGDIQNIQAAYEQKLMQDSKR